MCDPVTMAVATFALGATTEVLGYAAQNQEAKAVQSAAAAAYKQDQTQISLRQIQEADAEAHQVNQQNLEEAKVVSKVQASASDANVAGVSVDNIVADVRRQAARNRETIKANTRMTVMQLEQERKGSRSRNQGRINAAPRPNPLSLVAGIGGAALSGYNAYSKQMS